MKHFAGVALVLASVLPLVAQAPLQRRVEDAPAYVLGPGDQIVLHIADMEEIPQAPIRLDPSGTIDLPMMGRVQAGGLTVQQLHDELVAKASKYVQQPDVTINLSGTESRPVSVVGEVVNPGIHQLAAPTRLLDVVSLSGGLKPDAGPTIRVTRDPRWGKLTGSDVQADPTGGSTASYPLDALLDLKNPTDNISMRPGDVVSVPRGELIYVTGDVKKAGGFMLSQHRTMSVLQAVTMAEGLGPDSAGGKARILRPSPNGDGEHTLIPVDVSKIIAGKQPDIRMFANDVLFIPHSGVKVVTRRAVEAAVGVTSGVLIYR